MNLSFKQKVILFFFIQSVFILYHLQSTIVKKIATFTKTMEQHDLKTHQKLKAGTDYDKRKLSPSKILTEKVIPEKLKFADYAQKFRRVTQVDCQRLFQNSESEIIKAEEYLIGDVKTIQYNVITKNCLAFKTDRGYITDYLTEEEKNFPIAYSLLMYKNVEQTERLLRAIYRPQNIYCLHVDSKSSNKIYNAVADIAECFDNVFLTSRRISVVWGKMSVLEPEILCMKELWERSKTWKYFINLTGQEFPLKTNYELVKILSVYNGSNDIEATRKRFTRRWMNAPQAPHGVIPTKGAVHVAVSRGFVDYVLHDKRAQDILEWTNHTVIPDETFFSTLNHNPHLGVPGAYTGEPETTKLKEKTKPYLARFKNRGKYVYDWPCSGLWVRGICVFGYGDLPLLSKRRELFANKFFMNHRPFVYGCMEELIFNRTRSEYLGQRTFDVTWYETLGFVQNKVQ